MERKIVRLFVLCLSFMSAAIGFAQEPEEEAPTRSATDSIMAMHDSIVNNLNHQIQELKLQTIMMQEPQPAALRMERMGPAAGSVSP